MKMTVKQIKDTLEDVIDKNGMETLLNCLVEVCHDKASHVSENWQDKNLEKQWTKTAKVIDKTQAKLLDVCPSF